jgi:FkbM family methyltransferase
MLNKLKVINRSIKEHPVGRYDKFNSWKRFLKWQLSQLLFPTQVVYSFVGKSKLFVEKGMASATGNIYFGLNDFAEMGFLLQFVKQEDIFFDLGANVGVYSILASVNVGARSIALEPVQKTFNRLCFNIKINEAEDKIIPLLAGIADKPGVLNFTSSFDTENYVTFDKNMADVCHVPVVTLDALTEKYGMPSLIKMDVEGFEGYALDGGHRTLSDPTVKAILIEINGSSLRYGISNEKIINQLKGKGFMPYRYDPRSKEIALLKGNLPDNVLFLRDEAFVKERLAASPKYKILDYII